jgi:hypothetical protein
MERFRRYVGLSLRDPHGKNDSMHGVAVTLSSNRARGAVGSFIMTIDEARSLSSMLGHAITQWDEAWAREREKKKEE